MALPISAVEEKVAGSFGAQARVKVAERNSHKKAVVIVGIRHFPVSNFYQSELT